MTEFGWARPRLPEHEQKATTEDVLQVLRDTTPRPLLSEPVLETVEDDIPFGETPLRLEVMTARDICQLPDPPAEDELLGDALRRGNRTAVGGGTGEGKTTLMLQMLGAVTTGGECLGISAAGGGRALVVDAEQGTRSVKRLLRETGLDRCDELDYIRVPDGLSLDSNREQRAAIEYQLEQGGYRAVVFDPLYKLHTGDSNDERHAVDLMRAFDEWRTRFHFGLLLGCHTRKMPS